MLKGIFGNSFSAKEPLAVQAGGVAFCTLPACIAGGSLMVFVVYLLVKREQLHILDPSFVAMILETDVAGSGEVLHRTRLAIKLELV